MVRQAPYADRQRHERKFLESQQVLVHQDRIGARGADGQACAKLRHRWIGPFKVLQVLSPTAVKLELPSLIRVKPVFNVAVLKPFEVPVDEPDDERSEEPAVMEDLPPSPIIDQDGHERFIVEKVLKHKFVWKKTLFLVKWLGYEEQRCKPREFLLGESGAPICPLQTYLGNSWGWCSFVERGYETDTIASNICDIRSQLKLILEFS